MKHYDIIVVGSGGGSKITRPAANLGKKVAIIEKDRLGGTCLNRGCIPSKMIIHPADIIAEAKEAERFNIDIDTDSIKIDFKKLQSEINQTINSESDGIAPLYDKHENIDYYHGRASFVDKKTMEINGEFISADTIFLTVGVRPFIPNIKGLEETPYWTSTEALANTTPRESMIVIGGGYIGVEIGYAYSQLGTDVTFLVRNKLIGFEDEDIVEEFGRVFSSQQTVLCHSQIHEVSFEDGLFQVEVINKDGHILHLKSEALLVATGVESNADTLALEHTAVKTDDKNFIQVDDFFQTDEPGIYAFGDVIGRHLFRHTANYEGEYVFKHVVEKTISHPIVYPPVPHAIFTNPQVGGVGKTEAQLRDEGIDYIAVKNPYSSSAMGMALRSESGFVKVLVNKKSRTLEGVHIIGKEASNMAHMAIAYMKMGATVDDINDTIFIHPAINEIFRNAIRKAVAALVEETM